MEVLNKNIEMALERLDTSPENKDALRALLYKEHLNRNFDWNKEAPKEIKEIVDKAIGEKDK